jgi:hypothetical protein
MKPPLFLKICDSNTNIAEPEFPLLMELLHVPLQSIYRWPREQRPVENGGLP